MTQLINKNLVLLDMEAQSKDEAIKLLSQKLDSEGRLINFDGFVEQVYKREGEFPTSLGFNFAIPHGKCEHVKVASLVFSRLKKEISWSDQDTAKYIFLIAVPESGAGDEHLRILAQISRNIMNDSFRARVEEADNAGSILEILGM